MTESEKLEHAVKIAEYYGMTDGAHHKQWVIDQMVQILLGPQAYEQWLKGIQEKMKEIDDYEYEIEDVWDKGTAP